MQAILETFNGWSAKMMKNKNMRLITQLLTIATLPILAILFVAFGLLSLLIKKKN